MKVDPADESAKQHAGISSTSWPAFSVTGRPTPWRAIGIYPLS
jgi:hypothetical protein